VISNFIVQALKGGPITIYGDGSQTRSFCFVDDLIDGIIRFMYTDFSGPLNLGNPKEYKVLDIAKTIIDKIDQKLEIKYLPLPEDDPLKRKPSIILAKKYIDWNPKIDLDEGLDITINYFKNLKNLTN